MKKSVRFTSSVVAALGMSVLPQVGQAADSGDPDSLCQVSFWQRDAVALVCTPGEKIVFLPESFGNVQLPVYFAAINCDLRYPVVSTTGAVTCIYRPIKALHSDKDIVDEKNGG